MASKFLIGVLALGLASCVQTQEIPLQNNVWRLETEGRGLIGAASVNDSTLKRAAELTLEQGYTHFVLRDTGSSRSSRVVGRTPVYAQTNASIVGNSVYSTTTYTGGTPIVAHQANLGVTVIMLREGDRGVDSAIDARSALARYTR